MREENTQLVRGLGLTGATSLVIGTVIGGGIFLKTAVMAQEVGSPTLVLVAWVVAGLLSLAGALTYAELGAMLPQAGGEYVYLRRAYGDAPAFMYGWMQFSIASTATIAAMAIGFATFLSALVPLTGVWVERSFRLLGRDMYWQFGTKQIVAVALILVISAINCIGVVFGGRVQSALTMLKILAIAAVALGAFSLSKGVIWENLTVSSGPVRWSSGSAFGTAILAAVWAYGGWNNMPMVAGEIRNPSRNVPRALIGGMAAVIVIYCSVNLAYFYALSFKEVLTSNSTAHPSALPVATKTVQAFLGPLGGKLISIAFIISALGALNGIVLSSARVPFAMARNGVFFPRFATISARSHVPASAIIIQGMWASVLAVSGSYDQLTDFHLFMTWIFFGLTASTVFALRRKMPDAPRPYKTLGYPVIPFVFVFLAGCLVINTLFARPVESLAGILLIICGLPVFFYFRHRRLKKDFEATHEAPEIQNGATSELQQL